jgi:hypothetical protein
LAPIPRACRITAATVRELWQSFSRALPISARVAEAVTNLVAFATRTTLPGAVPFDLHRLTKRLRR